MIQIFNIFSVRAGKTKSALDHLRQYSAMCRELNLRDVELAVSTINPNQFAIIGRCDNLDQWQKFDQQLREKESAGDDFAELMDLLEKPPKYYTFETEIETRI